jgi:hypothetical protein
MSSGAPVEHGTPIRQPAVALLCVDSADAYTYDVDGFRSDRTTPASILINKQTPLLFGYMTRISLTEVNMAWATPNVNERNNTLTLYLYNDTTDDGVGFVRIAIQEYFHTPQELATAVQTALRALNVGDGPIVEWDVTYDARQSRFDISGAATAGGAVEYSFQIWNGAAIQGPFEATASDTGGVAVPTGRVQDDLTYMMGLTPSTDATFEYSKLIYGGFASCQYTPYVDIVSRILTKNQNVRDGDTTKTSTPSKLARIYLSKDGCNNVFDVDDAGVDGNCNIVGVRPFFLHKEFNTPKVISWNTTENVDIIDLQVLDRQGFPIYIEQFNVISLNATTLAIGNTASFQFTIPATET